MRNTRIKIIGVCIVFLVILMNSFSERKPLDQILNHESHFRGTVQKVVDKTAWVLVDEDDPLYEQYQFVYVPIEVEYKDVEHRPVDREYVHVFYDAEQKMTLWLESMLSLGQGKDMDDFSYIQFCELITGTYFYSNV